MQTPGGEDSVVSILLCTGEAWGRQRDGETQDGHLSNALWTTRGDNQLFWYRYAFKEAEAGAGGGSHSQVKANPSLPSLFVCSSLGCSELCLIGTGRTEERIGGT